jgi:hypothetical protein
MTCSEVDYSIAELGEIKLISPLNPANYSSRKELLLHILLTLGAAASRRLFDPQSDVWLRVL